MAQGQRISSFNIFQTDNNILVKFSVYPGTYVYEYRILHATDTDSTNYVPIHTESIPGGQLSSTEISYVHTTPAQNQVNYYKIVLDPYEMTPAKRIYVSPKGYMHMIPYPNPFGDFSTNVLTLRILNTNNLRFIGWIFNQMGNPLKEIDVRANGELATVDIGELTNGLYIVWLTDFNNAYNTKFVIRR
jgi:hypothetical protein